MARFLAFRNYLNISASPQLRDSDSKFLLATQQPSREADQRPLVEDPGRSTPILRKFLKVRQNLQLLRDTLPSGYGMSDPAAGVPLSPLSW